MWRRFGGGGGGCGGEHNKAAKKKCSEVAAIAAPAAAATNYFAVAVPGKSDPSIDVSAAEKARCAAAVCSLLFVLSLLLQ